MSRARLTIIDNGMIGHRFIEGLLDKSGVASFGITVFREEPRIIYDRVRLPSYFSYYAAEELSLVREGFYEKHGIKVLVGGRVIAIDRQEKAVHSGAGRTVFYDELIMVIDSCPWIPPIKGSDTQDCLVYRTIGDLNVVKFCARRSERSAVVGGDLLGLEAAGVPKNLDIETHIIEFVPMLTAEQFDQMSGEQLHRKTEGMDVCIHTSRNTLEIVREGVAACKTMRFADGSELEVDFIIFSTGIRPCDRPATQCSLDAVPRGDIVINDSRQTPDPDIYATGECANWNSRVSGLVVLDYKMAQVVVDHIPGSENAFRGADLSAKLKLLGVDAGGTGDAHGRTPDVRSHVHLDESKKIRKCLIVGEDNKTLLGVVLMDDTGDYGNLLQLVLSAIELLENPGPLILPAHLGSDKPSIGVDKSPDSVQICSCFDVTKGDLTAAINKGCHIVAALKAETRAGTSHGGCIPLVAQVLSTELAKQDIEANSNLYEHFAYSCQELFRLTRTEGIKAFEELPAKHDKGYGCEACKPTVGSLLTSYQNEYTPKPEHTPLQDFNNSSLANIQKDGTCLVIPRSPGGKITPEGSMAVGRIAHEFNLYTKIADSQRPAMFGAQKDNLPEIWRQLVEADFEIGHAYAKALRMTKVCVGGAQCHYGVGGSAGLGVELENHYKGIRMSYEMKFGVSGCIRECSETQSGDVGIIATKRGWNLYVCGNGGVKPRHVDLLAADADCETLTKYLSRPMMFYIRIADKLTRTTPWLKNLEGGIDYLKTAIIDDKLGLNAHLEEKMVYPRKAVVCEWTKTANTPSVQTRLEHFISSDKRDLDVQMAPERKQHRPTTLYERISVTLVEDNV